MAGRRLCGCGRGADAETSKRMLDLAVAGKAFERFREEEVDKAVRALAREKVTRPDGFSAGEYQHLSARIPAITILRNPIIITGEIRETLVQLHKAPLDKPRRVRTACSSKKLICLKNAASKALESGVFGAHSSRSGGWAEGAGKQQGYGAARGKELHPTDVSARGMAVLSERTLVYRATLDVDGAFDSVTREKLIGSLIGASVDGF